MAFLGEHLQLVPTSVQEKLNAQNSFFLKKGCNKFDHSRKGSLTSDEFYNVVKTQNGIDIAKDDVGLRIFQEVVKRKLYL